jgi:hypothetical protein
MGSAFTCAGGTIAGASGVGFAGMRTSCDQPTVNDIVTPFQLFAQ